MTITAAVTERARAPFALQELELGELRPGEVLVRVAAAGICHTDLICRDQWYPVPLPAVLGHEGAGIVERVGTAVVGIAPGDRVGMSFDSCGRCRTCQSGRPSYCHSFFEHNFASARADGTSALSRDGELIHGHFFGQSCFATHAVASERNVVLLDEGIPLDVAAPFGCGIQTGAGAVINALRAPAGSSIAVFGTGTVGLAAVLGAVVAGCTTIIGIDVNPSRLALARELGATHVIAATTEDAVERIRAITGAGVDFSLETTASPAVLRQAVECTAPTGICGLIGAPAFGTEVSLDMNSILTAGRTLRGIVEGDSVPGLFLPRLVELWQQGR
ncbi:MAG TPA: NAD(P)-dependent alcohol dehydrogenase, partial [Gaiellales bacterium]